MGLIGKNGAGKSTILKAILNMVAPEEGSVRMFRQDFYCHEKECKQQIGVVFGGIDFYPLKKLSAITDVTRRFYEDWDQEQYIRYLRRFALDEDRKFKELSNGMKVKYLLAIALSHHARLLILDEPTSGLDPVSRQELLHLFRQIVNHENCSILFSTHITSDLEKCADDIIYIQNGRVLQSGEKDRFLQGFEYLKTPEDTGPLTLEEICCGRKGGLGMMRLLYKVFLFGCLAPYLTFLNARETNDAFYTAVLPVTKEESVRGKCLLVAAVQLFQLLFSVPFAFLRNALETANNPVGLDATPAWYGLGLMVYGVFDLVFLPTFYQSGYKAGKAFILASVPLVILMLGTEAAGHLPALSWMDSYRPENLWKQLTVLIAGMVIYAVFLSMAYKLSVKHYYKVDL